MKIDTRARFLHHINQNDFSTMAIYSSPLDPTLKQSASYFYFVTLECDKSNKLNLTTKAPLKGLCINIGEILFI